MSQPASANLPAKLASYLDHDATFRAIYDYTRERFEAAPQLYAHDFEHARRDAMNAIAIGEPEGADMHVVLCAAIMHDIGYLYGADHKVHGEAGADHLAEFLADGHIALDPSEQDHIAACIRTHKGVTQGADPTTLEAKVVADADHLDKYGPVGVYQVILALNEIGFTIDQIVDRFRKGRDLPMFTATAARLADHLKPFNQQFEQAFAGAYAQYQISHPEDPS
jgi:HD superfamily phosphodiesterase